MLEPSPGRTEIVLSSSSRTVWTASVATPKPVSGATTSQTVPVRLLGASLCATVALFKMARAGAALRGRDFATPDDVKDVAPSVLRHRVALSPEAEIEGDTADAAVRRILDRVEVPEGAAGTAGQRGNP